jgi:hypothetical protein
MAADLEHDEPQELLRAAGRELRVQIRRHPYAALAAAAGVGLVLSGAGWTRWLAAGAALALREGTRWAAREGLRRIVEAPSRGAFSRDRATAQHERPRPH